MRVKNNSNALRVIRSRDVPVSSTMAKKSKNNASQRGSSTDNLSVAEKSKMKSKATATKSEKLDKSKATAVASMQDEKKRGKGAATVTTASLADGEKNNDDTSETMTTTMEKPKKLTTHSAASNNRGGGDKKMNNKKMSKELRNLGIDFNNILTKTLSSSSTTSDDKADKITASCGGKAQDEGSKLDESKTSICEMVKTKSRINVQSTYNRKNSDGGGASSTVVSASGSVDKDQQKIEKELLTTQAKNDDDVLGGGGGKKNAKGLNTTKDEEKQQCSSGGDVPSKQSNKSASKSKKNLKSTNNKVDEGSSSAANKVIEPKKKKQKKNGDVPAVEGEIVTPSEPTAPDTSIPIPSDVTVGKVAKKAATPAVKRTANQVKKAAAAKKLNDNVVVANENKKKKKGKEAKSTEAFTAVPTKENAKKKKLAPKGSAEQISLSVQPPPSQPASKISVKKLSELVDCEKTKLTEEQVDEMAHEEVEAAEETKLESSYPETPENDDSIMVAADDSTEKEFVKLPTDLPSPTPSPSDSPPDVDIKEEIIEKQIEEKSHFTQSSSTTKKPTEDNESDIAAAATTTTQANKKKTTKDDRKKKEATATTKPTTAVVAHKTNDTKQSQPVAKRKYTKKNILKTIRAMTPVTTKMEDKTESVSDEAPLSTIAKALSDVKDIYDFNESGNNSDSIEVAANIGTTKLQSSTIPPIYKRKLSTKSKDDIKDEQKMEDEPKVHENSAKKSKAAAKTKSIKVEPKSSSKRASKSKASGSDETNGDDTDNSTSSSSIPLERIASKSKLAMKSRRMKYFGFWTGPKRHRMASLNALAKVQCLYENESRSAQDLGLSRPQPVFKDTKPRTPSPSTSDDGDEEKDDDEDNDHDASIKSKTKTAKAIKKKPKVEDVNVTLRSLRNAPGLRGAGKLWEMDDLSSSSDDNNDSDKTYKGDIRQAKKKKKPNPKLETQKVIPVKGLKTPKKVTPKKQPPKPIKKQPKSSASDDNKSSDESDKNEDSLSSAPLLPKNKRKRSTNDTDILANKFKNIIVSKRIASLNASAILSATYEVERHLDRDLSSSSEEVNSEEDSMDEIPSSPRKLKELKNENDNSDETKEARPVSTSVVIVQDTDVTITGVYVNSSLGSNQEAYCKMQYRVQSSVTEERVLRPTGDPPKSYTPLSALSNMRPPGAQQDGCPSVVNSHQQVPQVVPPAPPPPPPPHHHHHHPMPPTVGPPLCPSAVRCESPTLRAYQQSSTLSYQPQPQVVAPPPVHHPIPSHHPQSVSAFCAPPPSSHADNTDIRVIGYYQPAGPLISSHLLPPQAPQVKSIPSPIDSDSLNLSQPPQSTSAAESSDSDVLITGGDLTPRPQTFRYGGPQVAPPQPPPGPYARPIHQMHCPTYPPSYYSPYSQHPQDMCYSPPYQPYYPAKVYPSTPPGYHRRYIPGTYYQVPPSDLYEAQASSAPPPTGSQIVPAGASGPQHMEHYPPPPNYYGYNPGGSPCYTRGLQPYIEPPPYQPSCPCPMQSCPKNVHTGPLIGSSTNKGPVPSHLVSSHTGTIDLSGGSLTSNGVPSCKTESLSPIIVKPEATTLCFQAYHHDATSQAVQQQQQQHQQAQIQSNNNNNITTTSSNECKSQQFEKVALTPLPNYGHSNSKVHEPQSSISPARGSTGPPQLSTQASATGMTQHQIGDTQPRRARIGKSMVRERQMAFQNYYHNYPPHQQVPVQEKTATENNVMNNVTTTMTTMTSHHHNTQSSQQLMKKEMESQIIKLENDIKEEEKDDCIILDNKSDTDEDGGKQNGVVIIEDSPEAATFKRKSSMDADSIITISSPGLSTDETAPTSPTNKRRKLLASAGPVGICASKSASSPLKSYKSLIKQADPKAYLCTPNKYQKRQAVNMIKRMNFKNGRVGKRRMMMKIHKVVMISNNKKMRMTARKKQAKKNGLVSNNASVNTPCKTTFDVVRIEDEDSKCGDNSSVDTAIETVARGYFSESEIHQSQHSIKTKTKKSKVKTAESRSKSESSRITPNNDDPSALNGTEVTEEMSRDEVDQDQNPKIDGSQQMETTSENSSIDTSTKETKKNNTNQNNTKQGNNKLQKSKSKLENNSDTADAVDVVTTPVAVTQNNSVAVSVENNNNNSLIYDNNNKLIQQQQQQQQTPSEHEESAVAPQSEPCLLLPPPSHPHSSATFASPHAAAVAATKRNRSRTRKFSNKKRHRVKHYNVECVEEVLIPRKTNSTPKWSNGWMWEGQPFQGKVFLNSDDPPVMRTCYPAMRHSEGDIILPWDCVLLRAGGKKFELPYVAKVAHLWENPEDGEMMMSLLWYYRPEHTEQGRQPADSQDEVFASRHKDHNSVACIEDRCYVLTFSEYCRYRRCLKSYQENVEETPSIVPPLPSGNPLRCSNRQVPPPNTSPELVMFCRRVYEFRLKRLMKTPN